MPPFIIRLFLPYMAIAFIFALPATAERIRIESEPVNFGTETIGKLRFLKGLSLTSRTKSFGGISELAISDNGNAALGVTDQGNWLWMRFQLANGLPTAIEAAQIAPIRDAMGAPFKWPANDAESLVLQKNKAFIGFETVDRIEAITFPLKLQDPFRQPRSLMARHAHPLPLPRALGQHPQNGGMEAIADLHDGRLLVFSEKGRGENGNLRAWIYFLDHNRAAPLWLRAPDGFNPTSARSLPSGDLLIVLRKFSPIGGLAIMIRRIRMGDIRENAILEGETIAEIHPPLAVDNMEGMSVRTNASGRTLLYLISDDNFSLLQRTLLLVFAMEEDT